MRKIVLIACLLCNWILYAQVKFVPGNLLILQSGDGTASTAGSPVSFLEISLAGNTVQTINIPSSGASRLVLANRGVTVTEGFLNLSDDFNYVTFMGYDADAGTASLQNSSSTGVPRAIGRLDTSARFSVIKTSMPGGSTSYVRSAVQADDGRSWTVGHPSFLRYTNMNSASSVSLGSGLTNANNNISIYNNKLYISSASTTASGLYKINTANGNFPNSTTEPQPVMLALPALGTKPNGFVFFDTNEDARPDLLYIADEALGLQKYYLDGSNWISKGAFAVPAGSSDNRLRGLTGKYDGQKYQVYGNTNSSVIAFTDEASPDVNMKVSSSILIQAQTNYVFRGVSFTPGTRRADPRPETYAQRIKNNTNLVKSINSNITNRIHPGMEETRITYTNQDDKPMALFFLTVDLKNPNVLIEPAMPNNQTTFGRQTVRNMITYKDAANTDYKVVAAVNADYWDTSTNGVPLGPVYINGTMIKDLPANYYFFSILNNKKGLIGDSDTYTSVSANIKHALGGRYLLLRDKDDPTASLNDNVEPRTSVGLISPTKAIYIIADGRRAVYSNGLDLTQLAQIYKAVGANDAINLDGGGSTTLIVKDAGGVYQTVNRPSDDSERAVANSWMILGRTVPLPVNLMSFTGKNNSGKIKLNWVTASEKDNSHFEIYRWDEQRRETSIATIEGGGNSTAPVFYNYTDAKPLAGKNYYQLNQVDIDGKSERSSIVAVNADMDQDQFSISFNGDKAQAIIYSPAPVSADLRIRDISGRLYSETKVRLQTGQNYVPVTIPVDGKVSVITLYMNGTSRSIKMIR